MLVGATRTQPMPPERLIGHWQLTETYAPILKARNPQMLTITAVGHDPSNYSDGAFRFHWDGDTTAYSGYYRGKQLWFVSPRRIGRTSIDVIYSGSLASRDFWIGQARPRAMPDAPNVPLWSVTAKRMRNAER